MSLIRGRAFGTFVGLSALLSLGCSSSKDDPAAAPQTKSEWKTQAYDVQSTWHNTAEKALTTESVGELKELWSIPLGSIATVTVVGNRVYTAGSSGIAAVDADSSKTLWRQSGTADAAIGSSASPAYDDGVLYIDNGANGTVYALNAETGDVIWKTQIEKHPQAAGYATPIVVGDRIYLGVSSNEEFGTKDDATFKGSVVAMDKKTGKVVWQTYTAGDGENGCAVWSTLAIDPEGGTVFASTGNNYTGDPGPGSDSIFAFDIDTGKVKWHQQVTEGDVYTINNPKSPDSDFGANPVVFDYDGGKYVAGGQKSGGLYVFDRTDGTKIAERQFGNGTTYIGGIFQALAWDGRYLYVVNNNTTSTAEGSEPANNDSPALQKGTSVLFALEPTSLDIVWERQLPAWVWSPMTLANGLGFVGAEKTFEAVDLSNGAKISTFKTAGTIIGAPVVNNGRVYLTSGLSYYFGHPDDKLYALALPSDPAFDKPREPSPAPDLSAPTFTNVYKAILSKSCAEPQCHGSSGAGNLFMTNFIQAASQLVHIPANGQCAAADGGLSTTCGCKDSGKLRVVPGDPDASLLVEKLSGSPGCGERMPPTGEPLSDELQELVKNWIRAGASAN